jgi:putative peptide zinc metalloprotease protein
VHPWLFPFDKPLQPGKGDNQALAVNTTDNTITYDVAFALVWVESDTPALNRNEAYAFASCTGCAAVSIGFQVVLVLSDNHVAAPQNISAAVNYDCVNCLTYALATQLFVTLNGPLTDTASGELDALWRQIADFGEHITDAPLSDIQSRLTGFEQQILQIIEKDQGLPTSGQSTTTPLVTPAAPSINPTGGLPSPGNTSGGTSATPQAPSSAAPSEEPVPGSAAATRPPLTGDPATGTVDQTAGPSAGAQAPTTTSTISP